MLEPRSRSSKSCNEHHILLRVLNSASMLTLRLVKSFAIRTLLSFSKFKARATVWLSCVLGDSRAHFPVKSSMVRERRDVYGRGGKGADKGKRRGSSDDEKGEAYTRIGVCVSSLQAFSVKRANKRKLCILIFYKVIGSPCMFIMSGMRSSTAHFTAMVSAKLNMYFHISACPCSCSSASDSFVPILNSLSLANEVE